MSLLGTINPSFNPESDQTAAVEARRHDPAASVSSDDTALDKANEVGNEEIIEAEVTRLAQQLTRQSTRYSVSGENTENPFASTKEDSTLNPASPNFKAKNWMKNLLAITSRDPERYPQRRAGVAFRNLSVHGFGSPTDYQKDVFNSVLQVGALARMLTGTGKQKIQILRDFDGLVKSGEMLVVLGRPGSGCSTFLKTLTGEMNGIHKDNNSHMNYQGELLMEN
jgi:ABC-type glutathione transport system ATPase component